MTKDRGRMDDPEGGRLLIFNAPRRPEYYILGGVDERTLVPVNDVIVWGRMFEDIPKRRVAQDQIGDVRISTVFLGLDHNFLGSGPPLIFETMIFGGQHDQYQDRCSTWAEAEDMHKRAIELVKGLPEVETRMQAVITDIFGKDEK